MAQVVLKGITKIYTVEDGAGKPFKAVDAVDLEIRDGEFMVLVGPSGCGKSTLLRMVAGLEDITAGDLLIGGKRCNHMPPKDRDIAMVFQNYALYPHMTVEENMSFGLKLAKMPGEEIRRRVAEAAAILGLETYIKSKPRTLSGGQRQRVALGRAMVRKPKVFLFDEPLSNLDAKMRVQMRVEISRLVNQFRTTALYVTHDQTEAMSMGHRIACMRDGHIQQLGTPMELYDTPSNQFVAGFIGMPPMNFLPLSWQGEKAGIEGMAGEAGLAEWMGEAAGPDKGKTVVGIRPEHIRIGAVAEGGLTALVEVVEPLGAETLVYCRAGAHNLVIRPKDKTTVRPGEQVGLSPLPGSLYFFGRNPD